MTQIGLFFRGTAIAACVAIGSSFTTPAIALADTNSTAALIAIGAIVGTLIFDSNQNQYYYVRSGRRVYVTNSTAQGWYQRQDPQWYNMHRDDFNRNPAKFDRDYRGHHHHPHP